MRTIPLVKKNYLPNLRRKRGIDQPAERHRKVHVKVESPAVYLKAEGMRKTAEKKHHYYEDSSSGDDDSPVYSRKKKRDQSESSKKKSKSKRRARSDISEESDSDSDQSDSWVVKSRKGESKHATSDEDTLRSTRKKRSRKSSERLNSSSSRRHKKRSAKSIKWKTSSSESTDSKSDSSEDRHRKKKGKPALRSAPKISYDGKGDWEVFEEKFQDYAEQMDWTPRECLKCLKWCLTGTAAKFSKSLLKTHKDITFKKKLGDRFGENDLSTAAFAQFNQAVQKRSETLEDWADRIRELAAKAFDDTPEKFSRKKPVDRFCQGMLDCQADRNVNLQAPTSLEDAVKQARLFQHVTDACFNKTDEREGPNERQ